MDDEAERGIARKKAAVVDEITKALGDSVPPGSQPWWHYLFAVIEIGDEVARALVREVANVEADGGMMTADGSRRRTPGGIFFALVQKLIGAKRAHAARAQANQRFAQESPGAAVPAPAPAPAPAGRGKAAPAAKAGAPARPAPRKRRTRPPQRGRNAGKKVVAAPQRPGRAAPPPVEVMVVRRRSS